MTSGERPRFEMTIAAAIRLAALGFGLLTAACGETPGGPSAYAAFEGRWTGTVAGEDWEVAVSTGYGRDLVRIQTPRGMAWQALPPRAAGGGMYPVASRYGGAVTLDMAVDGRLLVAAAGIQPGAFERWGDTNFVRFALPFETANALTNGDFSADGSGIRFKRLRPGVDRAAACAGDNPDTLYIDLFDPLEPVFVRAPAGSSGETPDARHAYRVVAARQGSLSGPVVLELESVEPRSDARLTIGIEGAGSAAITVSPSGAVYADCAGPAIAD